jgi:hypothetical protein
MSVLAQLKRWTPLLSFEVGVAKERNSVYAKTSSIGQNIEPAEIICFWSFATARILYDIWFTNTPQGFLALDLLAQIFERDLVFSTDCLKRANLNSLRYVSEQCESSEKLVGLYLARNTAKRKIEFKTGPTFEDGKPTSFALVSSVVLLQHILARIRNDRYLVQILSRTGRNLITQFALKEWPGLASVQILPQAAFRQAISSVGA